MRNSGQWSMEVSRTRHQIGAEAATSGVLRGSDHFNYFFAVVFQSVFNFNICLFYFIDDGKDKKEILVKDEEKGKGDLS